MEDYDEVEARLKNVESAVFHSERPENRQDGLNEAKKEQNFNFWLQISAQQPKLIKIPNFALDYHIFPVFCLKIPILAPQDIFIVQFWICKIKIFVKIGHFFFIFDVRPVNIFRIENSIIRSALFPRFFFQSNRFL